MRPTGARICGGQIRTPAWIAKEDDFQLEKGHRDSADESTGIELDDHAKKKSLCALIEENGDDGDDRIGLKLQNKRALQHNALRAELKYKYMFEKLTDQLDILDCLIEDATFSDRMMSVLWVGSAPRFKTQVSQ
ncbi:hypothetical protein BY996DRAFT_6478437 [Phakopsora pachyrhizi]|nr:hypothetical protein BY996DRAFT_6478437 [Phakopsora pachyrhizi]